MAYYDNYVQDYTAGAIDDGPNPYVDPAFIGPPEPFDPFEHDYQGPGPSNVPKFAYQPPPPDPAMEAQRIQAQHRYDQAQMTPAYLQGFDQDAAERLRLQEEIGNRQRYSRAAQAGAQGLETGNLSGGFTNSLAALYGGKEAGTLAAASQRMDDRTQKSELLTRWTAERSAAANELMYSGGGYGRRSRGFGGGYSSGAAQADAGVPNTKGERDLQAIRQQLDEYAPFIAEQVDGEQILATLRKGNDYDAIDLTLGRMVPAYRAMQPNGGFVKFEGGSSDEYMERNIYTGEERSYISSLGAAQMAEDGRGVLLDNIRKIGQISGQRDEPESQDAKILSDAVARSLQAGAQEVEDAAAKAENREAVTIPLAETDLHDARSEIEKIMNDPNFSDRLRSIAQDSINHLNQMIKIKAGWVTTRPGDIHGGHEFSMEDLNVMAKSDKTLEDVVGTKDEIRSYYLATHFRYPQDREIDGIYNRLRTSLPPKKGDEDKVAAETGTVDQAIEIGSPGLNTLPTDDVKKTVGKGKKDQSDVEKQQSIVKGQQYGFGYNVLTDTIGGVLSGIGGVVKKGLRRGKGRPGTYEEERFSGDNPYLIGAKEKRDLGGRFPRGYLKNPDEVVMPPGYRPPGY